MSVFFNKLCIILYKNIAHAHAQFYGAHFSMYQLICFIDTAGTEFKFAIINKL